MPRSICEKDAPCARIFPSQWAHSADKLAICHPSPENLFGVWVHCDIIGNWKIAIITNLALIDGLALAGLAPAAFDALADIDGILDVFPGSIVRKRIDEPPELFFCRCY